MPEAVKESINEQLAIKEETSPDKLPCKEVKPAEASSGTLPADEKPQKDAGEGAVAPDLDQEAPEQGKSEASNDAPLEDIPASDKENSEKESTIKPENTEEKAAENSNKEVDTDMSKEKTASGESLCQESKQPSPECGTEDSIKKSPDQNKTDASLEAEKSNSQDIKPVETEDNSNGDNKTVNGKKIDKSQSDEKPVTEELKKEETKKTEETSESMESNPCVETEQNKEPKEAVNTEESNKTDLVDESSSVTETKEVESKDNKIDQDMESMESAPSNEKEVKSESKDTTADNVEAMEVAEEQKQVETTSTVTQNSKPPAEVSSEDKLTSGTAASETQKEEGELKESVSEKSNDKCENGSSNEGSAKNTDVTKPAEEIAKHDKTDSENAKADRSDDAKPDESEKVVDETESAQKDGEGQPGVENGNADGSGSSRETSADAAEELKGQIREGKGLLATGDYLTAADVLGKACEAAGNLYGDLANENAELYYLYGCAMLECAKNENNVLGDGVKEKEDETVEETDVDEANGDEQMETEENGDGDEKMAVDGDNKDTKEGSSSKIIEGKQENAENGLEEATNKDGAKENGEEEEEEDSSLKVAWEMFELSKIAFTRMGNDVRLADTYVKLGEVGIESGHKSALDDLKAALELRKKCDENPRIISETHFTLGLGYATFEMFDEAIEQFKLSKSLLEAKIDSLLKVEEKKAEEEIKDIKELLPDLEDKIQDMQESKETKVKQSVNGEASSSSLETAESDKPVSNISHLVKRKRKLEDVASDLLPNTKQPCTEKTTDTEKSAN